VGLKKQKIDKTLVSFTKLIKHLATTIYF